MTDEQKTQRTDNSEPSPTLYEIDDDWAEIARLSIKSWTEDEDNIEGR